MTKVSSSRLLDVKTEDQRERRCYAVAVKMEGEATSQGMQATSRSWKRQRNTFSLRPLKGT